jgi:hypothetical protein
MNCADHIPMCAIKSRALINRQGGKMKGVQSIGWVFCAVVAFCAGTKAFAAPETYSESGVVVEIRPEAVVLQTESGLKEFSRASLATPLPESIREGDHVTVTYSLQAEQIELQRKDQEAGQVPDAPGIIDDRAFYPA